MLINKFWMFVMDKSVSNRMKQGWWSDNLFNNIAALVKCVDLLSLQNKLSIIYGVKCDFRK